MVSVAHFSTAQAAPAHRIAYWNEVVEQSFRGGAVQARHNDFAAEFWRGSVGPIRLMRAKASRSTVSRWGACRADAVDAGRVVLHLQNQGFSQTTQHAQSALLAAGDLTLCDAARPYTIDISDRNDLLVLDIPLSGLLHPKQALDRAAQRLSGAQPHIALLRRFVLSLWDEMGQLGDADGLVLSRVLFDLVNLALSSPAEVAATESPEVRDRIVHWISERLTDPHLCTSAIAQQTGYPTRTIQDLFARMGTTPTDYIIRQRLERARTMLADPAASRSITDVAFEVGFNDSNYFSRLFRQRFAMTPRAFKTNVHHRFQ